MILKNSILILGVFIAVACGSTKEAQKTEVLPEWVNKKPQLAEYYVGIGTAPKSNINYLSDAKNKALADLATEISSQVSSRSALFTYESTLGITDEFASYVKSVSNEQLEGFEMVTFYENKTQYWVYYRLNKQLFAEIKQKRLTEATRIGLDYLGKAVQFKTDENYYNAITNYLKGIETVKPYLNESLEVPLNGSNVFLGTELVSGLINTFSNIQVTAKTPELKLKSGSLVANVDLVYEFANANKHPLAGLPVNYRIGDKVLNTTLTETDVSGQTVYRLGTIPYKTGRFDIVCELDMERLARECTRDPFVRKMLRKFEAPKSKTLIILDNPTFFVSSSEKNLGEPINPKIIESKVMQILTNNEFPVVFNPSNADYTLALDIATEKSKQEGRFYYTLILTDIKILDDRQQLVYTRQFDKIEGVQLNYRDAGMDAYQKLSEYLDRNFMVKLNEALKR